MLDSNQCRRNAEYYIQLSESARAKKQKYIIKQLAVEWRRLSDLTERQEIHSAKKSSCALRRLRGRMGCMND
jgi:hypothetical protein